jgi:hypothetical protein
LPNQIPSWQRCFWVLVLESLRVSADISRRPFFRRLRASALAVHVCGIGASQRWVHLMRRDLPAKLVLARKALYALCLSGYLVASLQIDRLVQWAFGDPPGWTPSDIGFMLFMGSTLFVCIFVVLILLPVRLLRATRRPSARWIPAAGAALVSLALFSGIALVLVNTMGWNMRALLPIAAVTFLGEALWMVGLVAIILWLGPRLLNAPSGRGPTP